MYEVIDEVVFCECKYCGKPAQTTIYEKCCTSQNIECACSGYGLPVDLCYQCEGIYRLEQIDFDTHIQGEKGKN